jgi:hypothetical protein
MYARNVRIKLKANGAPEFTRILEKEIYSATPQTGGIPR